MTHIFPVGAMDLLEYKTSGARFSILKTDRQISTGDTIVLQEVTPEGKLTGVEAILRPTQVTVGMGLKPGFVAIGFDPIPQTQQSA